MYRSSAMEGLGGPVSPAHHGDLDDRSGTLIPSPHDDDPTLASCCAREIESNRQRSALERTLRRHDRVALAERRRRHLLTLDFGSGCRCCYDPNADGGEYGALREARLNALEEEQRRIREAEADGEEGGNDDDGDGEEGAGPGVTVDGAGPSSGYKPGGGPDSDGDSDDSDSEFDYLLDEDLPSNVTSEHEERRRLELEEAALYRESLTQHGYGVHRQHHPGRVLHVAGVGADPRGSNRSTAAVVHLYDPESEASAQLDLLLEREDFSGKYRGTKFLRAGGRPTLLLNAEMVERYLPGIRPEHAEAGGDLPCLLAVMDGTVVARCPRLTGLVIEDHHHHRDGDGVVVDARAVEQWLDHADVLRRDPPPYEDLCRVRPEEDALLDGARLVGQQQQPQREAKEEEHYDCGVPGCEKAFRHEHVGIKNERQDGLVVKENEQVLQEE